MSPRSINLEGDSYDIPEVALDKMIKIKRNFSENVVYLNNGEHYEGDDYSGVPFYDVMVNHPKLDRFIKNEIEHILGYVKSIHRNPEIYEKFKEAMLTQIYEEAGLPVDLIEEFLCFANSKKSARSNYRTSRRSE